MASLNQNYLIFSLLKGPSRRGTTVRRGGRWRRCRHSALLPPGCDPILGRAGCSVLPQLSSDGDDTVGCSTASGFSSSFSSRVCFSGLCGSAAAADARSCTVSRYSCPIPGRLLSMFCTCRSGAAFASLLKGCTSGMAVKPAGRPELDPSADDKAAVLVIPGNSGNSGAAEACTPSAACDSLFMGRPVSSFPSFTLAGTAGSRFQ